MITVPRPKVSNHKNSLETGILGYKFTLSKYFRVKKSTSLIWPRIYLYLFLTVLLLRSLKSLGQSKYSQDLTWDFKVHLTQPIQADRPSLNTYNATMDKYWPSHHSWYITDAYNRWTPCLFNSHHPHLSTAWLIHSSISQPQKKIKMMVSLGTIKRLLICDRFSSWKQTLFLLGQGCINLSFQAPTLVREACALDQHFQNKNKIVF